MHTNWGATAFDMMMGLQKSAREYFCLRPIQIQMSIHTHCAIARLKKVNRDERENSMSQYVNKIDGNKGKYHFNLINSRYY